MQTESVANYTQSQNQASVFLQRLKKETATQHTILEKQELLAAIMLPTVTLSQYAAYLSLMLPIELSYESKVLPLLQFLFDDASYNLSSPLIRADLEYLQCPLLADAPAPYRLPVSSGNVSAALGFMYVMEGSKLGGRFIYKHIQRVLGYDNVCGATFLYNAGGDTGREWKHFTNRLANYTIENNLEEEVIQGARQAFDSIFDYYQNNRRFYAD